MDIAVSVCITAYNVAPYISQAIEGILIQQTSFPFEIIVGEDCSTDNTRAILLSYKVQYPDKIRLVLHEQNVGVLQNDISVVKAARGKYIAWCDGDDYWVDPLKLRKQYEILENNKQISLVHSNWINLREKEGILENHISSFNSYAKGESGISLIEKILQRGTSGCRFSTCMFSRENYLRILSENPTFFIGHKCNDFILFISLAVYGQFFCMNDFTTVYRIQQESLSMTKSKEKNYEYMKGYYFLITEMMLTYHVSQKTVNIACSRLLNELLKYTFFFRKSQEADLMVKKSRKVHYQLSIAQKILYRGTKNHALNLLFKPILSLFLKY